MPLPLDTSAPSLESQDPKRERNKVMECEHTRRKHYAKGMCHNCYHRVGKTKKAFACGHPQRSHYSGGMCQNCYLAKYYLKRKQKAQLKKLEAEPTPEFSK